MVELFENLPPIIKTEASKIIDRVFNNYKPSECAQIIRDFARNSENKELQDFIDFYFNLKMEQLKDENNSN